MRVLCLYFPDLAMHVAAERLRLAGQVLPKVRGVCVVATAPAAGSEFARGVPQPPIALAGSMRISALSAAAARLGIAPGHSVARARLRCPDLALSVVSHEELQCELMRIAESLFAFGAQVAITASAPACKASAAAAETAPDACVWVDVTGCAGLHDADAERGYALLSRKAQHQLRLHGHHVQVGLADGPRVAAMLARAATTSPRVVAQGGNYAAIADLDCMLLPLPAENLRMLSKLGITTIGQLRALPAASLALRLGTAAASVMGLLRGDDHAPLRAYVPPEEPTESADLEHETIDLEVLSFVLKSICDRLAQRLAGRGLGATSISLQLALDRGIVPQALDVDHRFELSAPVSDGAVLLALLRARLAKSVLQAPVKSLHCTLRNLLPRHASSGALFSSQRGASGAFAKVLAELEGDLGQGRVGRLHVQNSWDLAERSQLLAWHARPNPDGVAAYPQLNVVEPTRLLAYPIRIAEPVQPIRLVQRFEDTGWWRESRGMRELIFAYLNEQAVLVEKSQRGTFLLGYVD